jgi:hypothetical protein
MKQQSAGSARRIDHRAFGKLDSAALDFTPKRLGQRAGGVVPSVLLTLGGGKCGGIGLAE